MMLTDKDGNPLEPKVVTLDEIVAKPSWDSDDIDLLVANEHMLDDEVRARLGIVDIVPATPDEVEKKTKTISKKKPTVAKKKGK